MSSLHWNQSPAMVGRGGMLVSYGPFHVAREIPLEGRHAACCLVLTGLSAEMENVGM
jgi:hypothetical protein